MDHVLKFTISFQSKGVKSVVLRNAILATGIRRSENQLLSYINIFNNVTDDQFPISFSNFAIILEFEYDDRDGGNHNLDIELVKYEDWEVVKSVYHQIVHFPEVDNPDEGFPLDYVYAVQFENLEFGPEGNYCFNILVDRQSLGYIPIKAILKSK